MTTWNERLAEALEAASIKPYRLAISVGVTQSTVSTWLGAASKAPAADLGAHRLLRVCEVLGVRPEWLISGEAPMRASEDWPFDIDRETYLKLPEAERRRISRFIDDTWGAFVGEL